MKIRRSLAVVMATFMLSSASIAVVQDAEAGRREIVMRQDQQRSVSVTGEGVVRVAPDEATITLVFRQRHEALQSAHNAVQRDVQRFRDNVVAAGMPADLVRSSALRYAPEYIYEQGQLPRPVAFNAETTVTLRVKNLADVPRLLEIAIDAGAAEIPPVNYAVSNYAEAQREARKLAMEGANDRARELAEGFGASVGEVLTINEMQMGPVHVVRYARQESMAMDSSVGSGASFAEVDPDAVEVRATVSVSFALR